MARRKAKEFPRLSVSSVTSYQTCPRRYYYSYVQRIQPIATPRAMRVGSAVHQARALFLTDQSWETVLLELVEPQDILQVTAIMQEYERWHEEEERHQYTTSGTEVRFSTRLWRYGPPVVGVIDEVIQDRYGHKGILEMKVRTRSHPIESLWENLQLAIYMAATDVEFARYLTIMYSNLAMNHGETDEEFEQRKSEAKCPSRIKRKLPETDEEYIARIRATVRFELEDIGRDDTVIAKRIEEFRAWSELIRRGVERKDFPQCTSACFGTFNSRRCPFYDLCVSNESSYVLSTMYEPREVSESFLTPEHGVVE